MVREQGDDDRRQQIKSRVSSPTERRELYETSARILQLQRQRCLRTPTATEADSFPRLPDRRHPSKITSRYARSSDESHYYGFGSLRLAATLSHGDEV